MASLIDRKPLTVRQRAILQAMREIGGVVRVSDLAEVLADRKVVSKVHRRYQTRSSMSGLLVRGLVLLVNPGGERRSESYRLIEEQTNGE